MHRVTVDLASVCSVVNLSSNLGPESLAKCSPERKKQLLACTTVEQINALITEYTQHAKAGVLAENGWPGPDYLYGVYGTSKYGLNILTRIQQANIDKDTTRQDIVINCCNPGYTATAMTHYEGYLTPDEAAMTPVFCALLPPNTTIRGEYLNLKAVEQM